MIAVLATWPGTTVSASTTGAGVASAGSHAAFIQTRVHLLKTLKLPEDFDVDAYAGNKPYVGSNAAGALLFFINLGIVPASGGTLQELKSTGLYDAFVSRQRQCGSIQILRLSSEIPQSERVASSCYTAFEIANLLDDVGDDVVASLCLRAHLFGSKRGCNSGTFLYGLGSQFPSFLALEDAAKNEPATFPQPDDIFNAGEPPARALLAWDAKHKLVGGESAPNTAIAGMSRATNVYRSITSQGSTALAPRHGSISCPCGWGNQPSPD